MTDLDELKDALHTPPGFAPRALDLDAVMAAGGRIRRRRRLATAAGAAVAAAGLMAGLAQVVGPGPGARPAAVAPAYPAGLIGEPVATGLPAGAGEYVLYGKAVDEAALPDTTFGFMLARRHPDGRIEDLVMANEAEGPDTAPGFHAVQGPTGPGMPTFGYYAGPAARITATAGGRTVTAEQAAWSADTRVVVFWFPPAAPSPTGLAAYDSAGRTLPAGHNGVGVG
jgi:hypothetical protein